MNVAIGSSGREATAVNESPAIPREGAVDTFRFVMAMMVILLHLLPSNSDLPWSMPLWAVVPDAICRSAVPYFFIVSGYYFRDTRSPSENIATIFKNLLPIYLFWSVVYLVIGSLSPVHWAFRPIMLLEGGYGFHLWFLPALGFGIATLAICLSIGGVWLAAIIAVGLAVIGPIAFSYHPLIGMQDYPSALAHLQRQLAAPAFVLIGFLLRKAPQLDWKPCLMLAMLALASLVMERWFVGIYLHNRAAINADGLVFTFLLGTSVFLLARSLNQFRIVTRFAGWGAVSLAIYVSHLLYVWLFKAVIPMIPGRTPLMFLLTAICAVTTSVWLIRIPIIRDFCTPPSARRRASSRT